MPLKNNLAKPKLYKRPEGLFTSTQEGTSHIIPSTPKYFGYILIDILWILYYNSSFAPSRFIHGFDLGE